MIQEGGETKPQPGVTFDMFWHDYPRKVARKVAKKAWDTLNPGYDLALTIIEAVQNHKKKNKQWADGFIPLPATFLNQERWNDATSVEKLSVSPIRGHQPSAMTKATEPMTPPLDDLLRDVEANPDKYRPFLGSLGKRMPQKLYEQMRMALEGKNKTVPNECPW